MKPLLFCGLLLLSGVPRAGADAPWAQEAAVAAIQRLGGTVEFDEVAAGRRW